MMEFLTAFIALIGANKSGLILLIPTIIGIASIIARATPSESDNKVVDVVSQIFGFLGMNPKQKGSGGVLGNKARK